MDRKIVGVYLSAIFGLVSFTKYVFSVCESFFFLGVYGGSMIF